MFALLLARVVPAAAQGDSNAVDDGSGTARGMNPNDGDSDGDGLGDGEAVSTYGSNPLHSDTDGDGYEVDCGQDPNTCTDYPGVVACG